MNQEQWEPPHIKEKRFQASVRRTGTIVLAIMVGIPVMFVVSQSSMCAFTWLIPLIVLAISFILIRNGHQRNRDFIEKYYADLQKKIQKPSSW